MALSHNILKARWWVCLLLLGVAGLAVSPVRADDLDREPIRYSTAPTDNVVSRLQQRIDADKARLAYQPGQGYLKSLLQELGVPSSSQVLVFSKTSMQRQCIRPRSPRALYFSDETYVGFCQQGRVLEISAVDPKLGTVFYTLEQEPAKRPQLVRQGDACLLCHASSQNRGFPGHLVRSVFADSDGLPILSSGTYRIDQTSPLRQRWGGWYVTGTHGKQSHLGNLIVHGRVEPEQIDNSADQNVTDLKGRLDTSPYLTGHSDIVALMVLEHQAEMHNLLTRASFQTRMALYEEAALNKELGRPASYSSETTERRIKSAGDPVVKYMLFSGEVKLTDKVAGTSNFAAEFARRGPRDSRGRSLRDFDLQSRLFRYPCSYLIYSAAFDALPDRVKDYVLERLWDVLTGNDASGDFDHLSAADRRVILEILLATKSNLPRYWQLPGARGDADSTPSLAVPLPARSMRTGNRTATNSHANRAGRRTQVSVAERPAA